MNMVARVPGFDGQTSTLEAIRDPDGEGKRDVVYVETRYDSVGRLYKQGTIERHHWEAACKLQIDAERASLIAQSKQGGSQVSRAIYQVASSKEYAMAAHADALRSVQIAMGRANTLGYYVLDLIVIKNCTMKQASEILRRNHKEVRGALEVALDGLARHYGLA